MPNIHTGTVFDVGENRTTGHSINNYLKWAGVNRFDENGIDYEPEDYPVHNDMEVGTGEFRDYYNSLSTLKDFGLHMASKGIDIANPNYNNPTEMKAARIKNTLEQQIAREASSLKSGMKIKELQTKERLKDGRALAPGGDPNDVTTTQDLDRIYNWGAWADKLDTFVKEINDVHAKEYDTNAQKETANKQIQEARKKLGEYKQGMMQQGIPEKIANQLVEGSRAQLGEATYNPLALMKTQSDMAVNQARIRNYDRDGSDDELDKIMPQRKRLMYRFGLGDQRVLGLLKDREIEGRRISNIKYDRSGDNVELEIEWQWEDEYGNIKTKKEVLDVSNDTYSDYGRLWSLLNDVMDPIDFDRKDEYPDPNFNKIQREFRDYINQFEDVFYPKDFDKYFTPGTLNKGRKKKGDSSQPSSEKSDSGENLNPFEEEE